MLIVSQKKLRLRISFFLLSCCAAFGIFLIVMRPLPVTVEADSEVLDILYDNGWTADESTVTICGYTVPEIKGSVLVAYNELQKQQGFDLTGFAGKTAERVSCVITNYPGFENGNDVRANLILYNGKVIAGDICCVRLNGFIRGIYNEGKNTAG